MLGEAASNGRSCAGDRREAERDGPRRSGGGEAGARRKLGKKDEGGGDWREGEARVRVLLVHIMNEYQYYFTNL